MFFSCLLLLLIIARGVIHHLRTYEVRKPASWANREREDKRNHVDRVQDWQLHPFDRVHAKSKSGNSEAPLVRVDERSNIPRIMRDMTYRLVRGAIMVEEEIIPDETC